MVLVYINDLHQKSQREEAEESGARKRDKKRETLRVCEPSSWVAERSLSSLNSSFTSSSEPTFPVAIKEEQTFG